MFSTISCSIDLVDQYLDETLQCHSICLHPMFSYNSLSPAHGTMEQSHLSSLLHARTQCPLTYLFSNPSLSSEQSHFPRLNPLPTSRPDYKYPPPTHAIHSPSLLETICQRQILEALGQLTYSTAFSRISWKLIDQQARDLKPSTLYHIHHHKSSRNQPLKP